MVANKTSIAPLPFDEQAEYAVLGSLLQNPTLMSEVSDLLNDTDFFLQRAAVVYRAFVTLADAHVLADVLTLKSAILETKDGRDMFHAGVGSPDSTDAAVVKWLTGLYASSPSPQAVRGYALTVKGHAQRRRAMIDAAEIARYAASPTCNISKLMAMIDALGQASSMDSDAPPRPLSLVVSEYYDHLESLDGKVATGLETGLRDYDRSTGGFQEGTLNILAARPGMGKSALAMTIALLMAKAGKRVYIWSGEMSKRQLAERASSARARVPSQRLRRGLADGGMNPVEWRAFTNALAELGKYDNVLLDDQGGMTIRKLEKRILREHRRQSIDLVIVDYIGLLSAGMKTESREREIGYISGRLKSFALEYMPVLALAQLNRDLEKRQDKRPQLSDLRDSGSLEQDSDTVTFIYRDVVYNEATEFPNRADLIIAKQRNGDTGIVTLNFEKQFTQFTDAKTQTIDLSGL